MRKVRSATGRAADAVRGFLDSRYGRELAHEETGGIASGQELPEAIDGAVSRWTEKRTDRQIEDELGIPDGLPYLTGLVCMHEARLEISARARSPSVSGWRHPDCRSEDHRSNADCPLD